MTRDLNQSDTATEPDKYLNVTSTVPMLRLQPYQAADGSLQVHWPITQFPSDPINPYNNGADPRNYSIHHVVHDTNYNSTCDMPPYDQDTTVQGSVLYWANQLPYSPTADPSRPGQNGVIGDLVADASGRTFRFDHTFNLQACGPSSGGYTCSGSNTMEVHATLTPNKGKPHAVNGGPYHATRANDVTLDGGQSYDEISGVSITNYDWQWAPGANCGSATLASAHESTTLPQLHIVPLCDLNLTLTVTDSTGEKDTTLTVLQVSPRTNGFGPITVTHVDDLADARSPDQQPTLVAQNSGILNAGLNVSHCSSVAPSDQAVFCPFAPIGQTHNNNGYRVAQVLDTGGPFNGFSYISATNLTIQRAGVYNRNMLSNSAPPIGATVNFYNWNKSKKNDIDGFLRAVMQHEGMGRPGDLTTGHTGLMSLAAATTDGNVVPQLEGLFAPTSGAVTGAADGRIDTAEQRIFNVSADVDRNPLPRLWPTRNNGGTLELWDGFRSKWVKLSCTVPGGCT